MKNPSGALLRKAGLMLVRAAIILALALGAVGLLFSVSFNAALRAAHDSLLSHPNPAADYAEAIARFQQIQQREGPELNPVCRSILLAHGQRTERAVVFFHGYTNCPQQFRQLGELFYQMGYNVLIPRLPRHGVADRRVENLSPLKAEELRDCADGSVDLASGLGRKVYVVGLSAGGTLAAWVAQNWGDVARAVLIAPALGFSRHEGTRVQKALALVLPLLPDIRTDWFSVDPDSPAHSYPGFSSRALGQLLRVSLATFADAFERSPRVQDAILITSQGDEAVNDVLAWQLMGQWRSKGLHALTCIDFPKAMKIPHDMIDPAQRNQQTEAVYPVLIKALNAP
jgi:pimeloyl-ACP methyl ester carboxylesterase